MPAAQCTICNGSATVAISWCDEFDDNLHVGFVMTARRLNGGSTHFCCNRCYDALVDSRLASECCICDVTDYEWVRKWRYDGVENYIYVGEYSTTAIVNGYH